MAVIWAQPGSNTYTDRLHSVQRAIASPFALSNYLALGVQNHLQPSDLKGFEFDGEDNDKRDETDVAKQFANLLSYSRALPARLPNFYNYLLSYPSGKPTDAEDTFILGEVKFGLKPTFTHRASHHTAREPGDDLPYAIGEKQVLFQYVQTALDVSFCVRGSDEQEPGF